MPPGRAGITNNGKREIACCKAYQRLQAAVVAQQLFIRCCIVLETYRWALRLGERSGCPKRARGLDEPLTCSRERSRSSQDHSP